MYRNPAAIPPYCYTLIHVGQREIIPHTNHSRRLVLVELPYHAIDERREISKSYQLGSRRQNPIDRANNSVRYSVDIRTMKARDSQHHSGEFSLRLANATVDPNVIYTEVWRLQAQRSLAAMHHQLDSSSKPIPNWVHNSRLITTQSSIRGDIQLTHSLTDSSNPQAGSQPLVLHQSRHPGD